MLGLPRNAIETYGQPETTTSRIAIDFGRLRTGITGRSRRRWIDDALVLALVEPDCTIGAGYTMVQSDQPSADATIGKAETPARQPLTFGQILVLPFVLAFFAARFALLFFVGLLLICLALYVLTYILDLSFVHHYLNNVKNSSYSIFHYWFPDERLHRMFPTPSK